VQRAVMDACEAVVFVSEADRTAAIAAEPGLTNRSRVVRNGVPPPPASARVWRSSGPIVYAGRLTRRKGIDLLGEVAPRLARSWSGRFVIAGGHGDADGDRVVGRLMAALGDVLDLPGWLSRVALDRLFASAALVLVPSRYEPFGLVPLEAMRLGAPVLAARVGGLAENVTPGSGGRLVDSHDPDAWCRAALAILDDPATGEELSRRGPPFVAARFNPRQPATQLIREVYMPLCCRAEARRPRTAVPRRGRWLPPAAQDAAARGALRW
jgi:glycosyltransferase involved in cell wall biosynthesis